MYTKKTDYEKRIRHLASYQLITETLTKLNCFIFWWRKFYCAKKKINIKKISILFLKWKKLRNIIYPI